MTQATASAPAQAGEGTTRSVVEGASDSSLHFRCKRVVESDAPSTAFGGPPSPLSRGRNESPIAHAVHQDFVLAAVDFDHGAVNEKGEVGGEIGDEVGDFVALGDA